MKSSLKSTDVSGSKRHAVDTIDQPQAPSQTSEAPSASGPALKVGDRKIMSDGEITAVVSAKTGELKSTIKRLAETASSAEIVFSQAKSVFESLQPLRDPKVIEIDPLTEATTYETDVVVSLPQPYPVEDLYVAVLFPSETPKPLLVIISVRDFPTRVPEGSSSPSSVSFRTLAKSFIVALVTRSDPAVPADWTVSRHYSDLLRELILTSSPLPDPIGIKLVNGAADGVLTPPERIAGALIAAGETQPRAGFKVRYAVVPESTICPAAAPYLDSATVDAPALTATGQYKVCGETTDPAGRKVYSSTPSLKLMTYASSLSWTSPEGPGPIAVPRKSLLSLSLTVDDVAPDARMTLFFATSAGSGFCDGAVAIGSDLDASSGSVTFAWDTTSLMEGQSYYLCAKLTSSLIPARHTWLSSALVAGGICSGTNLTGSVLALGAGTLDNPYTICTVEQLQDMKLRLTSAFELGRDIDAASSAAWNGGLGFEPIGTSSAKFRGRLDGNDRTISGLALNRPGAINVSLLGVAREASVHDLALDTVSVQGGDRAATLLSDGETVVLERIRSIGSVTGASTVGGLCGRCVNNSTLTDLVADVQVTASGNTVGGLVGQVELNTPINDAHSTGNVSGQGSVGGLVGTANNSSFIVDSSARGNVTGTANSIGGLAGTFFFSQMDNGIVAAQNVFATGDVTGSSTSQNVGGLIGLAQALTITNCFSTGDVVAGGGTTGGLIGGTGGGSLDEVRSSFATGNVTSNGTGSRLGGLIGNSNMQSVSDVWAAGTVTGFKATATYLMMGGVLGTMEGILSRSYATSQVIATGLGVGPGGLVGSTWTGFASGTIAINQSFAVGQLTGSWAGGIASLHCNLASCTGGAQGSATNTIAANVRWDSTSSGVGAMCGGQYGTASGCNNGNNISGNPTYWFSSSNVPMSSWDFSATGKWKTVPNSYPILAWQKVHTVFVTSTSYNGDLGGLNGADAKCAARAAAAGLNGSWKAMLSSSKMDLRRRLAVQGPIINRNGDLVARQLADLTDDSLLAPVRYDEFAADASPGLRAVWTGSNSQGRWIGSGTTNGTCAEWTSSVASSQGQPGDLSVTGVAWLKEAALATCDAAKRIYCIDQ